MKISTSPHRPPHIYIDDTWYFITASTLHKKAFISSKKHYEVWAEILMNLVKKHSIALSAWVVLKNHYHLLLLPNKGMDIGPFINQLHGSTSYEFNLLDNERGRKVWYSYWDTCIRNQRGFWNRFNYIHYNPVKHGYANNSEEWDYSSYRVYMTDNGDDWLADCWMGFTNVDLLDNDFF